MTDEKMAEEYCNNEVPFDTTESGEKLYTENDLKHAYLVALEAGRSKWHMVADGDLPKDDRYYLICSDRGNYYVSKHHCNTNYWTGIQNQYVSIKNVVAWCEIPKLEEDVE